MLTVIHRIARTLPLTLALLIAPAHAQSTSFIYQGELTENALPATGTYDLQFRLYDAASDGAQVGGIVCLNDIAVSAGRFAVSLDFGPAFAALANRHLEIQVRRDSGLPCSNPAGFILLGGRQPVAAAPLAVHAISAASLSAPDGSPANAVVVSNSGNVGIGTSTPISRLTIDEPGDANLDVVLDSGATVPKVAALAFFDRGAFKWSLGKDTSNNFYISATNSSVPRFSIDFNTGRTTINGPLSISSVTRFHSIHGAAFVPELVSTSNAQQVFWSKDRGVTGWGGQTLVAPVSLPHGATITALRMTYINDRTNLNIQLDLGRTSQNDFSSLNMATVVGAGGGVDVVRTVTSTAVSFPTVDNANMLYWLTVSLNSNPPTWQRVVGVRITYTINEPLP